MYEWFTEHATHKWLTEQLSCITYSQIDFTNRSFVFGALAASMINAIAKHPIIRK